MQSTLWDLLLKGTLVLAAGCAGGWILRRAPAAMRHLLWALVAIALLALPILELSLPVWEVRALPTAAPLTFVADSQPAAAATATTLPVKPVPAAAQSTPPARVRPQIGWVAWLWLAGTVFCLVRLLAGVVVMHRMRARAEAAGEIEGTPLLRSAGANMPMTIGILHPAILLPAAAENWPEDRLRMVLAHELAHIRRRDCLVQTIAQAGFSLFWFHPLAWWAWKQLVRERERASDDLVLAAGFRASDYAAQLLEVARWFQPAGVMAGTGVAMARRSELEGRLLAILDTDLRRGVVGRAGMLAGVLGAMMVVLPLAAMRPAPQVDAPEVLPDELLRSTDYNRLSQVGKAELEHGYLENAQKLYERSLELRKQAFGEQSAEYATAMVDLARVYQAGGRRGVDAVKFYQQALPIQEARLGPNDSEVATTLYYLALSAHKTQPEQARQLYQRALDIRSKAFGSSDPRVAQVMTSLARLTDDEMLFQRSLSILNSGEKTSELALTEELYAKYLRDHNRAAEAEPLEAQAKEIRVERVKQIGLRRVRANAEADTKPFKVGSGVTPPKLKSKVEPEYSDTARIEKYQGTVRLYMEVNKDGRAQNIKLLQGIGMGLDEKAAEAVNRWTFVPGTKDGQPVTVAATVEVNFKLL
jgi:TonB family protein